MTDSEPIPIPVTISKIDVIAAANRNAQRIRRGAKEVAVSLEDIADNPSTRLLLAGMKARALDWEAFANDIARL